MNRAAGYAIAAVALLATGALALQAGTAAAAQAAAGAFDPKDFSGTWDRYNASPRGEPHRNHAGRTGSHSGPATQAAVQGGV